jgi:hypothetical protein
MAQSIRTGGHSDQMDVIGHQAVSPNVNTVLPAPIRHQIYIGLIVTIIEESLFPPIASLGDMVRVAWHNYSCNSCHEIDYRMFVWVIPIIKYGVPRITIRCGPVEYLPVSAAQSR